MPSYSLQGLPGQEGYAEDEDMDRSSYESSPDEESELEHSGLYAPPHSSQCLPEWENYTDNEDMDGSSHEYPADHLFVPHNVSMGGSTTLFNWWSNPLPTHYYY